MSRDNLMEEVKRVEQETGVNILDFLCDVRDNAYEESRDENGVIDMEMVCMTITDEADKFIDFYKENILEVSEADYWDGEIDDADYYGRPFERF